MLSSPYSFAEDAEIRECFPNGPKRTIGMVEIRLDNGVTGLGEGYLAVFAPLVFREIVNLCAPYLIGQDALDIARRVADIRSVCDYWSRQGAARHVISAIDIALHDAAAKCSNQPLWKFVGHATSNTIRVYGSGGCCDTKEHFFQEFEQMNALGIGLYKIRSAKEDINRTLWVLEQAADRNITVAVDMCQNLAESPQSSDDAMQFVTAVHDRSRQPIVFLEEAVGPETPEGFVDLRNRTTTTICGGETITTPNEMIDYMQADCFDFVQPDATVIGGVGAVMAVFRASRQMSTPVVVHAWGGAVSMMANYHSAFAGGGGLVEYPLLDFPLATDMLGEQCTIRGGNLDRPAAPGLGVTLTADIERRYPFDESAVYSCKLQEFKRNPDTYWL